MKLLHLFVGKPQVIPSRDGDVLTSIYKNEVSGKHYVSKLNIAGDAQADLKVHGGPDKAVYAYPIQHYELWKKEHPDLEFSPGVFGENLSISGMDEITTYIGDQISIGEVVLEVAQPRMPCFKLGIKMGDPRFIKSFLLAKRSGFYFRVLEEGSIQPGDEIEILHKDKDELSIHEVVSLYSDERNNIELLRKAVSTDTLMDEWKSYFSDKLEKLEA